MKLKQYHKISKISFRPGKLLINIDDVSYEFLLSQISTKLAKASKTELETYKVSPSGYGIHWSLLEEDLSIDGILGTLKLKRTFRSPRAEKA